MLAMMASTMESQTNTITGRGSIGTSRQPKLTEPRKHVPFKEEEGVLKMIEDYHLIKQGKSKKGIGKQNRIKNRINEWLKSGMLNEIDLKK